MIPLPLAGSANLQVSKTTDSPGARKIPGETITYTITIANTGDASATGVVLNDAAPANTTDIAATLDATPVARDDAYPQTVMANMSVDTATSGFSAVANDFTGYLAGNAVAVSGVTITSYTQGGHGTVAMTTSGAAVGRFIYTPAPGYTGTDSFTYTIARSGVTESPGTAGSRTATVTLTVGGPVIWFVDGTNGSDTNNGTLGNPFRTLTAAVAVDAANHRLFLYAGNYATGITLTSGEWLVGQSAVGASFDAVMGINPGSDTPARPAINGGRPTLAVTSGNAITLGNGNTVNSVTVNNTTGSASGIAGSAIGTTTISDIAITTVGGGTALSATTSGTLTVTGTANTLSAANGTALNVVSVTIGAGGLTFRSISSNGGTTSGIVLSNTGSSGGLTITGDSGGSNNGSGGTIQNKTVNADGIRLTSTKSPSFGYLNITNNDGSGITAASVSGGITINRCTITGNGDQVSPNESGVNLVGSTGTATFTNTTISNSYETEVRIEGSASTPLIVNMTGCTISNNGVSYYAGNLLNFIGTNTADLTLNLTNSTFTGNRTAGFLTGNGVHADTAGGSMSVNVSGCTFQNNYAAVNVSAGGGAFAKHLTFDIHDNTTITGSEGNVINVFANASCLAGDTFVGKVRNNTIGTLGAADSGSRDGDGVRLKNEGPGTMTVSVTGNVIQEIKTYDGISAGQVVSPGTLNATITDNTIRNLAGGGPTGVNIFAINTYVAASGATIHTTISDNTITNVTNVNAPEKIRVRAAVSGSIYRSSQASIAALATANGVTGWDISQIGVGTFVFGQALPPLPLRFALGGVEASSSGMADMPSSWWSDIYAPTDRPTLNARDDRPDAFLADSEPTTGAGAARAASYSLAQTELDSVVAEARARWAASGLTATQIERLRGLRFEIADLSNLHLAEAAGDLIRIDSGAAGRGWFVSSHRGEQFPSIAGGTRCYADPAGAPAGRIDLLTAILHEMGHALGLDDVYAPQRRDSIMFAWLTAGERRLPTAGEATSSDPVPVAATRYLLNSLEIGTLPAGKSVVVTFQVTVSATTATSIGNTATVTADGDISVASNTVTTTIEQPPLLSSIGTSCAEDGVIAFSAATFDAGFSDPNAGDTLQSVRITSLPANGTLRLNSTAVGLNEEITRANLANLTFTPTVNFHGLTSFTWNASDGLSYAVTGATATLTVVPVADGPSISAAATEEDTQNISGLVISRHAVDGAEVTHFKITAITNGTLFQSDGTTAIVDNAFITYAQAQAGLKFLPAANLNSPAGNAFSFAVQGATGAGGSGLGASATATLASVSEVNDPPVATGDTLAAVSEDSGQRTIDFGNLLGNDTAGPANESAQILIVSAVSNAVGGTVQLGAGSTILFTPAANFTGAASFDYTLQDDGTTATVADPKTATGHASFTVSAVNDAPTITVPASLSGGSGTPIAVTGVAFDDSDAAAGEVTATFTVVSGTLAATSTGDIAVGGAAMSRTLTGTVAHLNAFLGAGNLTYTGTASGTLGIVINDQGNTGSGGAMSATASIPIVIFDPPAMVTSFGAASVPLGGTTTLTFTVTNSNTGTALTGISFTDNLPAGLVVATPSGLSGTLGGGMIIAVAGSNTVSLSGATLAASSSGTFTVEVTGTTAGVKSNSVAATSSNAGAGNTATASLTVVAAPGLSKAFGAASIPLGTTTTLTFTVTNSNLGTALGGITFTDPLPAGLVVAATPNVVNNLGGTVTAEAGASVITLTGGSRAANGSATLSVDVTGTIAGAIHNVTSAVSSVQGGAGGTAAADLTIVAPPSIAIGFSPTTILPNGTSTLTFTITNPNASVTLTDVAFTHAFPAGMAVAGIPNASSTAGGTFTAIAGAGVVSLTGGTIPAGSSVTLAVSVTGSTSGTKNNTTGNVTSTNGGSGGTASGTLTVAARPTVTTTGGVRAATERVTIEIDPGVNVTDADNATLAGATVAITANFNAGEDVLALVNDGLTMGNIVGSYNSATGALTLTSAGASATVSQWQAALRAVTYTNTSHAPATAIRTITFIVSDGVLDSDPATRSVSLASVNDAPVVTTSGGTTAFVEGDNVTSTPVIVDGGLWVSDADHPSLASATVSITGNFQPGEDVLAFTYDGSTMGNIVASYNSATGVLTLTSAGAISAVPEWRTALRSVTYTNTSSSPNPATRTVSFAVNDGAAASAVATKSVSVAAVNDTPVVAASGGTTAYVEANNGPSTPVIVDAGVTVSDADHATLAGATVSISDNFQAGGDVLAFTNDGSTMGNIAGSYTSETGMLMLTSVGASATVSQWQTALASVTYANSSNSPNTATRTVSFVVSDGAATSAAATKNVSVTAINDSPVVVTSGGATAFTEPNNTTPTPVIIDAGVTVSDADHATLASGTISIAGNFQATEDVLAFTNDGSSMGNIAGSYSSAIGVLTLTSAGASATVSQWQTALASVTFANSSNSPNTATRTVSFVVNDGAAASATAAKGVSVSAVNDSPVVATSSGVTAFTESNDASPTPVIVDAGVTVSDADHAALATATVSIANNFQADGDVLAFINDGSTMGNIAGSYSSGTGGLTLTSAGASATLDQWQAALRAVSYTSTSSSPSTATRAVSFVVSDGAAASAIATKSVSVTAINDAPVVVTSGGTTAFVEANNARSTPVIVDAGVTVSDSDHAMLATATVAITGNFQSGEDVLAFSNDGSTMGNIAGSYGSETGLLALASAGASATLAQWEAALRSVTYSNDSDAPATVARSISFVVNDGASSSFAATRAISVVAVNDTPTDIELTATTLNQSAGPNGVVGTLAATDLDDTAFAYTLVSGSGAGDNAAFNLSSSSAHANGIVALRANNAASLAVGSYQVRIRATDGSGAAWEETFTVLVEDNVGPVITAVTGPATGTYRTAAPLEFAVTFNEIVNVAGTPVLNLAIGVGSRTAAYVSGTGTNTLLYRYVVQPGDYAVGGAVVLGTLELNGGTIRDDRGNDASLTFSAPELPDLMVDARTHSADTNFDWRISLLELTRVIELYNTRAGTMRTGEYHTQSGTEDGFGPGAGPIATYHSADGNHDQRISLVELTRIIELYNTRSGTLRTGGYHGQNGTEDGFAPGP